MSAANVLPRPGFLDRERIVAASGYSRWLVPPCALAIHLCIGMAVAEKHYMTPEQLAARDAAEKRAAAARQAVVSRDARTTPGWQLVAAWVAVGVPIAWGVWVTLQKAAILFGL